MSDQSNSETVIPSAPVTEAGKPEDQRGLNGTTAELAEAMRFLGFALRAASNYDPAQPDHGRASVVAALVGVNQLIAALFPNEPALPVALIELACALKDLDRGTVAPLLKHAELGHRPPNALSDELFRAIPAAAMTLQMKAGKSRDDAADEIANRLIEWGTGIPRAIALRVRRLPSGEKK